MDALGTSWVCQDLHMAYLCPGLRRTPVDHLVCLPSMSVSFHQEFPEVPHCYQIKYKLLSSEFKPLQKMIIQISFLILSYFFCKLKYFS